MRAHRLDARALGGRPGRPRAGSRPLPATPAARRARSRRPCGRSRAAGTTPAPPALRRRSPEGDVRSRSSPASGSAATGTFSADGIRGPAANAAGSRRSITRTSARDSMIQAASVRTSTRSTPFCMSSAISRLSIDTRPPRVGVAAMATAPRMNASRASRWFVFRLLRNFEHGSVPSLPSTSRPTPHPRNRRWPSARPRRRRRRRAG